MLRVGQPGGGTGRGDQGRTDGGWRENWRRMRGRTEGGWEEGWREDGREDGKGVGSGDGREDRRADGGSTDRVVVFVDFCGVNTPHMADFPPTRSVQAELRSGGQVRPRHRLIPATHGSARSTSINHSKTGSGEF